MVEVNVLDVVKISFLMIYIDWYILRFILLKLNENYAKNNLKFVVLNG